MHSLRVLWAIPNACWNPFALTRCLQRGTVDSARSPLTHHRPLIDLNDHDECCIGPKWRVHAHTHENASCAWFDHTPSTHARRRAGHPLAGGRIGKQNAVRTILGRLVSQDADNARMGNGVSAFGRALRAPVQAFGRHSVPQCRPMPAFGQHSVPPAQASAGLRPGTPYPSAGLRPANGLHSPFHCGIVCIMAWACL